MSTIERICESCDAHFGVETAELGRITPLLPRLCDACLDRLDAAEAAREAEVERRRIERVLPRALRHLEFAGLERNPERHEAIEGARKWAESTRPGGVLLHGPVGSGKTRIAATAAWCFLERGRQLRWTSVPVLLAKLTASFGDEDRASAIQTITGTVPLVLDDLDKTNASEWARSQLFAAIDERVAADAPLFVTTNLPPEGIARKLGDAIASRLAGYCRVFELRDRDHRVSGAHRPIDAKEHA